MRRQRVCSVHGWSRLAIVGAVAVSTLLVAGCGGAPSAGGGGGDNVLVSDALSFQGSMSGKLVSTQSTRGSQSAGAAAQEAPPDFDTTNTCIRVKDLMGNDLLDANGQPYEVVDVDSDGGFSIEGLPVGTDFTVCGDIGKDGSCEFESCIQIPSEDGGLVGDLQAAQVDPLTTTVLAKLRRLMEIKGVDVADLPFSPATVVERIVGAYTNLFEESGIDQEITREQIGSLTLRELAEFFDSSIPELVRSGMQVVEGNLALAKAGDVESTALAAAEVFLHAGFPIADEPGGVDLSALADIEGVEVTTLRDLFAFKGPFDDEFAEVDEGFGEAIGAAQVGEEGFDAIPVYVSTATEPNRNFSEDEMVVGDDAPGSDMPVIFDYLLMEMARLQVDGRRITLASLYDLLTSVERGLGARLTYFVFDPNFVGPPLTVFQTENGEGKAINLEKIFRRFSDEGFGNIRPEDFDRQEQRLRRLIAELLGDTIPPAFKRFFGGVTSERIAGIGDLADRIREARAHLPFSRSGPSAFFVVADGDVFRDDTADVSPVSVNADLTVDGEVLSLSYDPSGNGTFYLGFSEGTEEEGFVELLVRETGRFLHTPRGPVRVNMNNDSLFEPIDGQPFIDFVSTDGSFYPGTTITVIRSDFIPEPFDPSLHGRDDGSIDGFVDGPEPVFEDETFLDVVTDGPDDVMTDDPVDLVDEIIVDEIVDVPTTDGPVVAEFDGGDGLPGPHEQVFVLAERPGGDPVAVDFDRFTGTVTFNPNGRYVLMFLPESEDTGVFALFNEQTGRIASRKDPADFFKAPIDRPDRFEEFFNEFDRFDEFDVDGFDSLEEFDFENLVGDFLDELPPDGEFQPMDEEFPPIDNFDEFDEFGDPILDDPNAPVDDAEPPVDDSLLPAQVDDGTVTDEETIVEEDVPAGDGLIDDDIFIDDPGFDFDPNAILVHAGEIIGLDVARKSFNNVFGVEVANERYNADGDPYYDDINGNATQDENEPTAPFRPTLFDPGDWRSTDLRLFYRRADNGESVSFEQIDFESATPRTLEGVELVPRNYLPRLNAFRFGRPNTAINLLTAFLPPEFFNGTNGLSRETRVDVFSAIAIINMVMDQVLNVEADIDIDGLGPLPKQRMLIDANIFLAPVGDPFVMLIKGFQDRSERFTEAP
jgi:hypothetical protein